MDAIAMNSIAYGAAAALCAAYSQGVRTQSAEAQAHSQLADSPVPAPVEISRHQPTVLPATRHQPVACRTLADVRMEAGMFTADTRTQTVATPTDPDLAQFMGNMSYTHTPAADISLFFSDMEEDIDPELLPEDYEEWANKMWILPDDDE